MGYSSNSKDYRLLNEKIRGMVISRNVIFNENEFNLSKSMEPEVTQFYRAEHLADSETESDDVHMRTEDPIVHKGLMSTHSIWYQ